MRDSQLMEVILEGIPFKVEVILEG